MGSAASYIPGALSAAGTLVGMFGTNSQANAQGTIAIQKGQAQATADEFRAQQMTVNAGQDVASAERQGITDRDAASLLTSKVIAGAGGGAMDPTTISQIGQITAKGSYNQNMAIYNGESQSRSLLMAAAGENYDAQNAIRQGEQQAQLIGQEAGNKNASSLLSLGSSLFSKYGATGTGSGTTTSGDSGAEGYVPTASDLSDDTF